MPVDAAGRTVWNDKTRSDLLQAIIDVAPPNTKEWDAIAVQLRAKGYTYNYSAALQHLQKLKKKEGTEGTSEPGTPKKAGEATAAKGKKSTGPGNKRKRSNAHKLAEDEDEDEDDKKVMKKIKPEVDAPKFSLDLEDGLSVYEDGVI
ncbi:hypothetical protein E0Z10_g721 [Xylaria hypoxylon]|uniref:Myb-like domain-containing protein n=1 Tax=Xylaria hypoxylon TaxID=37992 RepID=A0A4Z0ZGN6_9PEZI|nr:hypothetical protein E0Z10_g721 [Xylaria hypoxylon]